MTRVSRRSHFCPVSHNKALSSRELDVHRATRHEMHKLGSWHNGTYVSGNAQATQCHKVTDWLAVVGENLSCALHRCCRRYLRCCRNLLKSTLLPPLTSPAPPAPPLRPDHLQHHAPAVSTDGEHASLKSLPTRLLRADHAPPAGSPARQGSIDTGDRGRGERSQSRAQVAL